MFKTVSTTISAVAIAATSALITTTPAIAQIGASVEGRYKDLVQTMHCPQAEDEYGTFNNYGYWEGGDYICGDQYAEEGFWVYDYPNWYVWDYDYIAAADGRYDDLVQVLACAADYEGYGEFNDYGYWAGGSWCGDDGAEGYWVYMYPNWYIWANQN